MSVVVVVVVVVVFSLYVRYKTFKQNVSPQLENEHLGW